MMAYPGFAQRHIGPNEEEKQQMLDAIGLNSVAALIEETVPKAIRATAPIDLPEGRSEHAFLNHIKALSEKNQLFDTYIGLGYHPTVTPPVIQRNILENPEIKFSAE